MNLVVNLTFIITWTVQGIAVEFDKRYIYELPNQWWRIMLFVSLTPIHKCDNDRETMKSTDYLALRNFSILLGGQYDLQEIFCIMSSRFTRHIFIHVVQWARSLQPQQCKTPVSFAC